MGMIRKAVLIGAGYVLGARAGTDRYDEIVRTARALAARPEVQSYLSALREKTGFTWPAAAAPDVLAAPPIPDPVNVASPLAAATSATVAPPVVDPALGSPVDPATVRRRPRAGRA